MNMTAPALFISHGAPTFALEPGQLGSKLSQVGELLGNVKALLVVSPHWQTRQTTVMTTPNPRTMHDFGGFAPELYRIDHPAIGYPTLAAEIAESLAETGRHIGLDDQRGLDHGAWVPLRYLDPKAHIPSFQVSLRSELDTWAAVRLGRALSAWRAKGVAIIGSGSLTHNLYEWREGADDANYAIEFRDWVRKAVLDRDIDRLMHYRELAPHAQRAHPTEEHFLPLLVAVGATFDDEPAQVLDGGMTYGVLSMESYAWGLPPLDIAADPDRRGKNGWSVRRMRRSTPGDRHDEGGVACRSAEPASGPAFKAR